MKKKRKISVHFWSCKFSNYIHFDHVGFNMLMWTEQQITNLIYILVWWRPFWISMISVCGDWNKTFYKTCLMREMRKIKMSAHFWQCKFSDYTHIDLVGYIMSKWIERQFTIGRYERFFDCYSNVVTLST